MTLAQINAGLASTARMDLGGKGAIASARQDGSAADRTAKGDIGNGIAVTAPRTGARSDAARAAAAAHGTERNPAGARADSRSQAGAASPAASGAALVAPSFARMLGVAVDGSAPAHDDDATEAQAGVAAPSTLTAANAAVPDAPAQPALPADALAAALFAPAAHEARPAVADDSEHAGAVQAAATLNAAASRLDLSAAGVAVVGGNVAAQHYTSENNNLARQASLMVEAGAPSVAAARIAAATAAIGTPGVRVTVAAPADAGAELANADAATVAPAAPAAPAATSNTGARFSLPAADAAQPGAAALATTASRAGTAKEEPATVAAVPAPVAGASAPAATTTSGAASAVVKLAGAPEQWQQPLRDALGDRLQLNLQRNNDHAVIRLEPPNMGSVEISIRHSAGALQVNLSASNSEVLRQLNTIGDSVRQDLSQRQYTEVAVTVSASRAQPQSQGQAQAQSDGGRQQREQEQRTPGRALNEDEAVSTFAMYEQE